MESDLLIVATTEENAASMLPPATGSSKINVDGTERIVSTLLGAATTLYGLRHLGSLGGLTLTLTGGLLLYRGLTGYCPVNNAIGRNTVSRKTSAMETNGSFVINKPKEEVYNFWRKLDNLPLFMKHLEEVKVEDNLRSVWKAKVPGGMGTVTWESVITEDRPGELLSWASLPGSTVDNAGEVRFKEAANGGTEIQVCMTYRLPGGDLGTLAGKLFNPAVENMIREDVRRFQSIIETGDVSLPGSEASGEEKTKTKKVRQSRKKPDPSLEHGAEANELNESDLLERT
jgi:uncharacterized membrane protein